MLLDFLEIWQFAEIVVFLSKKRTMSTPVILGKENWTNNPVSQEANSENVLIFHFLKKLWVEAGNIA